MARRKTYNDDFRASAVLMLEAAGYPGKPGALSKVAQHLNVPARTLSRWFKKEQNPPPDQLVALKRGEMVQQLEDMAVKLLAAIDREVDTGDAPLRELATTFGIVTDKWLLLRGEPTARSEVNATFANMDEGERHERLRAIVNELNL